MKSEIEKALANLEEYFIKETDRIRDMVSKQSKSKDLFSITTYSEVCKELKEKEETCPYKKIKQIEKLFNGEWKKDWSDRNQPKWYPYFEYKATGGFVFCVSHVPYYGSVGQVSFYKDKATSDYVGKTFIDIYKEISQ